MPRWDAPWGGEVAQTAGDLQARRLGPPTFPPRAPPSCLSCTCMCGRRHEARRLPDTAQSDVDPRRYDALRSDVTADVSDPPCCQPSLRPTGEWVHAFLKQFERLRDAAQRCARM